MKILAVDAASKTGAVAVLQDHVILAEMQATSPETHARRLMPAIDSTLHMAGIGLSELDGFAVTIGPGSFTALRIGISTIKGLWFVTRKPVAAISTLDALAYQFPWFPDLICPVIDAGKGEIYTALYRCRRWMEWNKVRTDCAVDPEQWLAQIEGSCLFVGSGVSPYRKLIEKIVGHRARFAPPYINAVRASVVACIGLKQIQQGQVADVPSLVPYYIRRSDAEIKLQVSL
ncbi:MAG: tRNA (adenosine(37)-N6)-threonylcarbamoyltransferase complex dimerization subunit type 1 TsaB [Deltaproteobacteria bacterium]|nr:MAG: tRNA (adenosine(37)-N6)-threonylcarbamoyltransferase complex dimerization subunit type 1 TsaB [Deltaproteobacteria bacterium]